MWMLRPPSKRVAFIWRVVHIKTCFKWLFKLSLFFPPHNNCVVNSSYYSRHIKKLFIYWTLYSAENFKYAIYSIWLLFNGCFGALDNTHTRFPFDSLVRIHSNGNSMIYAYVSMCGSSSSVSTTSSFSIDKPNNVPTIECAWTMAFGFSLADSSLDNSMHRFRSFRCWLTRCFMHATFWLPIKV